MTLDTRKKISNFFNVVHELMLIPSVHLSQETTGNYFPTGSWWWSSGHSFYYVDLILKPTGSNL